MPAAAYDIEIEAGASFAMTFGYGTTDEAGVYTAIPLPGYTARFQMRDSVKTPGDPFLEIDPLPFDDVTSTVTLALSAAVTATFTRASYAYGIELVSPGDEPVIRLAQARVNVSAEVVR